MQATIGRELFLREFAEIAREIHRPITYTALLAGMNGPNGQREAARGLAVIVNGTVIRRANKDQMSPEAQLPRKLLRRGHAQGS